jgi:hypothetical protein
LPACDPQHHRRSASPRRKLAVCDHLHDPVRVEGPEMAIVYMNLSGQCVLDRPTGKHHHRHPRPATPRQPRHQDRGSGCYGAVEGAQPGRWLQSSYTTSLDVTMSSRNGLHRCGPARRKTSRRQPWSAWRSRRRREGSAFEPCPPGLKLRTMEAPDGYQANRASPERGHT